MKKPETKKSKKENSPEPITPEEALRRMKSFPSRKENFVAAIKKSKN